MSYRLWSRLFFFAGRGTRDTGNRFGTWPLFAGLNGRIHVLNLLARIVKCNAPLDPGIAAALAAKPPAGAKRILRRLHDDLNQGIGLIAALERQPHVFSKPHIALLSAGEASGKLGDVLQELEANLRDRFQSRMAVFRIMLYVLFVLYMGLAVGYVFQMTMEAYLETYSEFGVSREAGGLPYVTALWLKEHPDLFRIGSVVVGVLFVLQMALSALAVNPIKSRRLARVSRPIALHIPVLGRFVKAFSTAHAADILSNLVGAGYPLDEALDMAAEGADPAYAAALLRMRQRILDGSNLSQAAHDETRLFPASFGQMTAIGEYTGDLPRALANLAHLYRDRAVRLLQVAEAVAAPLATIVLGLVVLALAYCAYGLTVLCATIILENM
ncbi:MAG TPA: type II secretion system F family protein [Candidatus Bathyarchaeia archaeon]|nr:type II secretion system F family protein [Candidatus Bathyarchaeia archaeon]